jgi:hypothetical protein
MLKRCNVNYHNGREMKMVFVVVIHFAKTKLPILVIAGRFHTQFPARV